jgi:GR25 family glycosyltransferase involved in LPS biosynthesis
VAIAAKQICHNNRSSSWSTEAPHVYYINLDKSTARNSVKQNALKEFGYNFTRVNAIQPWDLVVSKDTLDTDKGVVMSCTSSHLEAVYTAVCDYKRKSSKYKKNVHYALIMEDDSKFMFDVRDWKGLIESAPKDWNILQLVTVNPQLSKSLYEDNWVKHRRMWEKRTVNELWGTGAYLINMDSLTIRYLFGNPTKDEEALFSKRFDSTKLFYKKCNNSDISMSSRIGCKAFLNNDRDPFGAVIPADYFMYNLGNPHTFTSSIPLINFQIKLGSTVRNEISGTQDIATFVNIDIVKDAISNTTLPSYLSSSICLHGGSPKKNLIQK